MDELSATANFPDPDEFIPAPEQPAKIPYQKLRNFKALTEEFRGPIYFTLAFIITASIAFLNYGDRSQTAFTNILLVALGGIFQTSGYSHSHKAGRADPTLVSSAVRDLYGQVFTTRAIRIKTQQVLESSSPHLEHELLRELSVHLGHLEEGMSRGVKNWAEFHSMADEVIKEMNQ